MQHGDAEPESVNSERPLSQKGTDDIQRLCQRMQALGIELTHIFHSGKRRAEQTAGIISQQLAPMVKPAIAGGLKANDDPAVITAVIEQMDDNVLIASHMPFVSRLCSTLLTGSPDTEFASQPGTLFCLEKNSDRWRMIYMLGTVCF